MRSLVVGIAGGSGSGQSTLARHVAAALAPLSVVLLDMDGNYRNFADQRHADLIVPHATDNVLAVEMIVATIRDRLRAEGTSQ